MSFDSYLYSCRRIWIFSLSAQNLFFTSLSHDRLLVLSGTSGLPSRT